MNAQELQELKAKALGEAEAADSAAGLEAVRIKYLGTKGLLPAMMKGLKDIEPSARPLVGRIANEFKQELQSVLSSRKTALADKTGPGGRHPVDCTLPGRWRGLGVLHPISRIVRDAAEIFARLGFTVADGPDVETKHNNFEALNTPDHHPSVGAQDTFWLTSELLLRTQTSPVQIRVMESRRPPVRVITPGRCYRRDRVDATHSANFTQIEGLYVDDAEGAGGRCVSMAQLKADMAYFAREMMGPKVRVRFRPHFFPFTEPSVECDFSCHLCDGKGCKLCKGSGWLEIAGAGMVHPKVLRKVGYDPEQFSGYAFGMGVERVAMVKYGISDIRLLYDNDVRFLAQLG